MSEIVRNRTIRPLTRLESSNNYKVDTKKVTEDNTLRVNIDHESLPFRRSYIFSGIDLSIKDSISFHVHELNGDVDITWSTINPTDVLYSNSDELGTDANIIPDPYRNERLFRLTYNTKDWTIPSGHSWNIADQGNNDIAFENQYGFGGEEWLFNPNFQHNGVQYGYIRGAEDLNESLTIKKAFLYTIEKLSGERYLVGIINNLTIIQDNSDSELIARNLFNLYYKQMKIDLQQVDADVKGLDIMSFISNICFALEDFEFFSIPLLIPALKGRRYNRFKPYIMNKELTAIIAGVLPEDVFVFRSGIATNTKSFSRTRKAGINTIERLHGEITDKLAAYLSEKVRISTSELSVEKTYFGANIADVVIKEPDDEYSIFEVKTSNNARKNIREAIGQLLDYAFWYSNIKIKSLVIVSPSQLGINELETLKRIKKNLVVDIKYFQYISKDNLNSDFKEIIL